MITVIQQDTYGRYYTVAVTAQRDRYSDGQDNDNEDLIRSPSLVTY